MGGVADPQHHLSDGLLKADYFFVIMFVVEASPRVLGD